MTRRKKTNKKHICRVSAIFLILIMMLGTFVGCGSAKTEDEKTASGEGTEKSDGTKNETERESTESGEEGEEAESESIESGGEKEVSDNITESSAAGNLHSPWKDGEGNTVWDCVWFGNYWQNDTNGDGTADQNDDKEPIKWRVLSVEGNEAFLLADMGLDYQPYYTEYISVTWETCTLRNWLNDSFLNHAFSSAEQAAIQVTNVVNADNLQYGTNGGNDTSDKVYLLSIDEGRNAAYGFDEDLDTDDKAREAKPTAYAREQGKLEDYEDNCVWWLRSPGHMSDCVSVFYGGEWGYGCGCNVNGSYAVRPALRLTLSSSHISYAGTVKSDGTADESGSKKD